MYTQAEKPKENKSRPIANSIAQKKSNVKQSVAFVDNRPLQQFSDKRKFVSQLMSVRTVNKTAGVDLAKHIVPLADQADWAKAKEKPKTTFITSDAEAKVVVDSDTYDFPEATDALGYKAITGNITTTQYDKTGDNRAGQPVTLSKASAKRNCTIGVTKKAGTDDLVINHLQNQ